MTAKINKIICALCVICGIVSCSSDLNEEQGARGKEQEARSEALRFNIFDAGTTTRAATDGQTMTTTFELADQAGLYAVKGGQVLLENIPLTYNASGFWEAAEAIEATGELSGAQFYAYYPYTADAQFNASSATPFAQMVAAVSPGAKQSTKADYEAADIMVTAAATIGQYNAVNLPLQHQKAMVCVELPNSSYIFDNAGMDPYVVAKAENVSFTLDGNAVQPYFDEASQSYRLIVEPGQDATLKATFTNNGADNSYETPSLAAVSAGQYAKFVVDGGASLINTTLHVGDYYCADGHIVSKDATVLPNNIVGIVFKVGTTESIRNANSNWSHGVVVALNEPSKTKWGIDASPTSAQNTAGWRYWYKDFNLADQNGKTNAAQLDESIMYEEGYEVTLAWRAVPEPLTIGGETLDYTTVMNATFDSWNAANALPAVTTGWYIPSLRDWINMEAQRSVLDAQLSAAGGKAFSKDPYWSCNVRGAGSNWCYVLGKTALADRYKGTGYKDSRMWRFLFAF